MEKKIDASRMEVVPNSEVPPEAEDQMIRQAGILQREKEKEFSKRVRALLQGQAKPPNEFVEYALTKMREAKVRHDNLREVLGSARAQVKQAEGALLELEGELNTYTVIIGEWDHSIDKPAESGEEKKE